MTTIADEKFILSKQAKLLLKLRNIAKLTAIAGTIKITTFRLIFKCPIHCTCHVKKRGYHLEDCLYSRYFSKLFDGHVIRFDLRSSFDIEVPVKGIKRLEIMNMQEIRVHPKLFHSFTIRTQGRQEAIDFYQHVSKVVFQALKHWIPRHVSTQPLLNFELEEDYARVGLLSCKNLMIIKQSKWSICESYPRVLVISANMTESEMLSAKAFRSRQRVPVAVWRNKRNGCILARSSQPLVGIGNNRNSNDEKLVVSMLSPDGFDRYSALNKSSADTISEIPLNRANSSEIVDGMSNLFGGLLSRINKGIGTENSKIDSFTLSQTFDEKLSRINSSPSIESTSKPHKFVIFDARGQLASYGNKAFGRGTENKNNYYSSNHKYLGLENIHYLRKAFEDVKILIYNESPIEEVLGSNWAKQTRYLLAAANDICYHLDEKNESALIHCSDGWDRTSQLTSLVQVLMDPWYRTVRGFLYLIFKEWISFGHKFRDRSGFNMPSGVSPTTVAFLDEFSPVFIAWLEVVWNISKQFPTIFEFNEEFLLKLGRESMQGIYPDFFFNSAEELKSMDPSLSLFQFLCYDQKLRSPVYEQCTHPILPSTSTRQFKVWENLLK